MSVEIVELKLCSMDEVSEYVYSYTMSVAQAEVLKEKIYRTNQFINVMNVMNGWTGIVLTTVESNQGMFKHHVQIGDIACWVWDCHIVNRSTNTKRQLKVMDI